MKKTKNGFDVAAEKRGEQKTGRTADGGKEVHRCLVGCAGRKNAEEVVHRLM